MSAQYSASTGKYSKKRSKKWPFLIAGVILLAVVGVWFWHRHNQSSTVNATVQTNTGKPAVANPNVPGSQNNTGGSNSSASGDVSKDSSSNSAAASPGSSVQPATPTGGFVSYHSPNLSGKPGPNTETSTCTTTPGVKCEITFTNGSVVQSLPAQTTSGSGTTIWTNWTLQSIGLTKGTWLIKAVAINGNKTATAQDPENLVVGP